MNEIIKKPLVDANGNIVVNNLPDGLKKSVVNEMKKARRMIHTRRFDYDTQYRMLITNIIDKSETTGEMNVEIALWPDESRADSYVSRLISFSLQPNNIVKWETFIDAISDSRNYHLEQVIGSFFVGRLIKKKYKDYSWEELVVDEFIAHLDYNKVKIKPEQSSRKQSNCKDINCYTRKVVDLLEDED